jgi:hypothetical protein
MEITKDFPDDYSADETAILNAMSLTGKIKLLGSMSLREQQYAGDYDGFEQVRGTSVASLVSQFKGVIRRLQKMKNVYIGDIKSGSVPQWAVLRPDAGVKDDEVINYNYAESVAVLKKLKAEKIITPTEYKEGLAVIHPSLTPPQYTHAADVLKFHIVRWTPAEVLAGHTTLRNGEKMTLAQSFQTPALTKLDVVGLVAGNRYTDFSVIYEFTIGKHVINPVPGGLEFIDRSLRESVVAYMESGNYFKVLKRLFSLARIHGDKDTIKELTPFLNSDMGRLYFLIGDIDTLLSLIEGKKGTPEVIRFEVDQFIHRLANVSLPSIVSSSEKLNASIRRIEKLSPARMATPLENLKEKLNKPLQESAKPIVFGLINKHKSE